MLRLQIARENRMNVHKNARLTPHGRERIVRQIVSGQTPKAVGEAAGVRSDRSQMGFPISQRGIGWTA